MNDVSTIFDQQRHELSLGVFSSVDFPV